MRFLSYRNQYIYLLCKIMDWFLYDCDIYHERVKETFTFNLRPRPEENKISHGSEIWLCLSTIQKVHNTFVTSWKHCIMLCQNRIYLPSGDPMKVWCNNLFFPPFISDKTRKYILLKQTSNRYRFVTKMLKIYPQSNFWKGFKTKQQPHSPFRSSCSTQKVDHCALDILDIRLRNQQRLIMNSDI